MSSTQKCSTYIVNRFVANIISCPPLASLVVGGSIHLFSFVNATFAGDDYLANILSNLSGKPVYGLGQLLIPFLVPFGVTSIGKLLSQQRQSELLGEFPEMNPDLIFKLNKEGKILYANPSVHKSLLRLELPEDQPESLLPPDFCNLVNGVYGQDSQSIASHCVGEIDLEFLFSGRTQGDSVFVSGRDTTELHRAQRRLKVAQSRVDDMINYLDQAFSNYGQDGDGLESSYIGVLKALMSPLDTDDNTNTPPTHVFLAEIKENLVNGFVYTRDDQAEIQRFDQEVVIDPQQERYAILEGINKLTWANWETDSKSIELFQERFHPLVRSQVGIIERFAAYNSGRIAIIAFYKGQQLTELEAKVLKELVVFTSGLHRISHERQETEKAFIYTVDSLARASEANDEDTGDHIIRINEYSRAIAQQMALPDDFIKTIHYSAQMHDVGKIHVSPNILKKPGRLTPEEIEKMKEHPQFGAKILGDSKRLSMAAEIANAHHEKYNGKGYPLGIAGEDIPLSARIVSITDVYDALRQKRVYKPAFSHKKAMEIITIGDGRTSPDEFDPKVLTAFKEIHEEMANIFDRY
jgi:HD-GYP domain-containing protein (c-di-GMP phosphodiesterase class II)